MREQILSRMTHCGGALALLLSMTGCGADRGSTDGSTAVMPASAERRTPTGQAVQMLGVFGYNVSVHGGTTMVELIDANGDPAGSLASYPSPEGRRMHFQLDGACIEFEYAGRQVAAYLNGEDIGHFSLDRYPVEEPAELAADTDAGAFAALQVLANDPALAAALQAARAEVGAEVPEMLDLRDCPPLLFATSCVRFGAMCIYCFVAWL